MWAPTISLVCHEIYNYYLDFFISCLVLKLIYVGQMALVKGHRDQFKYATVMSKNNLKRILPCLFYTKYNEINICHSIVCFT